MKDIIARYRKIYIKEMRKDVGHAPLMVTACGVIIENDKGEILLQKRRDNRPLISAIVISANCKRDLNVIYLF